MPGFDYLILWKDHLKKNTWEFISIVIHLQKMISIFYKKYLEKLTALFLLLNSTLLMAKPLISKNHNKNLVTQAKKLIKKVKIKILG